MIISFLPCEHDAARALWERFCSVCGPEELRRAYDYPATFRFPLPTERVWAAHVDGAEAGWLSLVPDPAGMSASTRAGMFPAYRRRGLWRAILEELRRVAFSDPAVQGVRAMVLLSNAAHAERMLAMTQTVPWYRFDGLSLHPPAYHILTRREDWEAR